MADLSYLEGLSNKELHNKMLQHGLPNVPVTDSSRSALIRRLHTAITGVHINPGKKTNRRETIAAVAEKKPPAVSTSADDLESLSNKDLHNKCVQHGLPNVPVTDSNRNVLVQKLRKALKEEETTRKASRRETIAAVQQPKEKPMPPPSAKKETTQTNRRATVAQATTTTKPVTQPATTTAAKRATLQPQTRYVPMEVESAATQRKEYASASTQQNEYASSTAHGYSRPDLFTKSSVVSTNYRQEAVPLPELVKETREHLSSFSNPLHNSTFASQRGYGLTTNAMPSYSFGMGARLNEEMEVEDEDEEEEEEVVEPKSYGFKYNAPTHSSGYTSSYQATKPDAGYTGSYQGPKPDVGYTSSYQAPKTDVTGAYNSSRYGYESYKPQTYAASPSYTSPTYTSGSYNSSTAEPNPRYSRSNSLSKSGVVTTSYRQESLPLPELLEDTTDYDSQTSFTRKRYSAAPRDNAAPQPVKATYQTPPLTTRNSLYPSLDELAPTRSTAYGGYTGSSSGLHARPSTTSPRYSQPEVADLSENDVEFSSEDDMADATPSYPKRRSVLRQSTYNTYQGYNAPRRYRSASDRSVEVTFWEFVTTLEEKYHLRQAFVLIMCFIIAVIIYVFLFQPTP